MSEVYAQVITICLAYFTCTALKAQLARGVARSEQRCGTTGALWRVDVGPQTRGMIARPAFRALLFCIAYILALQG